MPDTIDLARLERDGFCILDLELDRPLLSRLASTAEHGGSEVVLWYLDRCPPDLVRDLTTGAIAAAVGAALGPEAVFLSVKLVTKGRGEQRASPWHQDRPYWGGALPKYSLWLALDDATASSGCLRVVPGSHRRARAHQRGDEVQRFGHRLEITAAETACATDVPLRAGQAVLFHDLLLHASHPAGAGRLRRGLIATYRAVAEERDDHWRGRGEAVRLSPRRVTTSGHGGC